MEGGFETVLGWFGVKWEIEGGVMTMNVSTPVGTSGVVAMPSVGGGDVSMDGMKADTSRLRNVEGGEHVFVSRVG